MHARARSYPAAALLLFVAGSGCDDESASPEPGGSKSTAAQPPAEDGPKSDGLVKPVDHGELMLGETRSAELTRGQRLHAWELEIAAPTGVRLHTQPPDSGAPDVDTVVFVYQQGPTGWGAADEYIAMNDDDDGDDSLFSEVEFEAEPGRYRIVVTGYSPAVAGEFALHAGCAPGTCPPARPVAAARCLLGQTYRDFLTTSVADTVSAAQLSSAEGLSDAARAQLGRAVAGSDAPISADDAFERVDEGQVVRTTRQVRTTGDAFTAYEYGAGGNSYGAIFAGDSAEPAALIADGALVDCAVDAGPGVGPGKDCERREDCWAGHELTCEGVFDGRGRCAVSTPFPGEGSACGAHEACDEHLFCNGLKTQPEGSCQPDWMRSSYVVSNPGVEIPDLDPEGATVRVPVYGLASVIVDVEVGISLFHPEPQQLLVELQNPDGTVATVFDGSAGDPATANSAVPGFIRIQRRVARFPGDESVNGEWALVVKDTTAGAVGRVESVTLDLSSRWD